MTTYISVVNYGLEDINEVPLTAVTFGLSRGVQSFMKSAVNRAFFDIANESTEWPWLQNVVSRVEGTTVLNTVAGTQWYDLAATTLEVDWETFYVTDKDPAVTSETPADVSRNLIPLTYDQWSRQYREADNQRTSVHRGIPQYVVRHPNGKIGFTPVPDAAYYVEYFLWKTADYFVTYSDDMLIPPEFDNVLHNRVRYYSWLFRENLDQANLANRDYKESLASMKRILLSNKSERMRAV